MPIPFIFMAIAGATAAVGAGKTIKAAVGIEKTPRTLMMPRSMSQKKPQNLLTNPEKTAETR